MSDDSLKIRITADDLKDIEVASPGPVISPPPHQTSPNGPRRWGSISGASSGPAGSPTADASAPSIFLKSWVYLGLAGLIGAFLAWAVCEPGFHDRGRAGWGNIFIFPLMITAICVAFATAESIVERSMSKAPIRGILALILGLVLGFVFYYIASFIYVIGQTILAEIAGEVKPTNPSFWFVRAIAWAVFGVTGGIIYGIAGQSGKKCLYGMLGGMLGAGIGGFLFDPISILCGAAEPSRCIGMMFLGATTGISIGLVESALKNRWLYVAGGPLAGKQFILYKPATQLGSQQTNDIYLFKDLSISPVHATITLRGPHATLFAVGPTFVAGQPVTERVLRSGDIIQIGRYTFHYQEKQAQG